MLDALQGVAFSSFELMARMAPYLLLGVFVAGILHLALPVGAVSRHLGRRGTGSVLKAAVMGIPLPICSCGVVPVAAGLKRDGASDGATVSFLVTTPTTGVDSILATYSLLGLPIAIARIVAAFVLGTVSGILTNLGGRERFSGEVETGDVDADHHRGGPIRKILDYALDELMGGIARPLFIGTILGGAIAYFVPDGFLAERVGEGYLGYLVMLAVGIPLYVCASGSLPLAAALLAKGMSPGAAIVFLIAGPATNMATMTVIGEMLGKRTLAIYLAVIALGSLAAGAGSDALFSAFSGWLPDVGPAAGHDGHGLTWVEIVGGAVVGVIIAFHGLRWLARRLRPGPVGEGTLVLEVPDMTCAHCAATITGAVEGLDGVGGIDANPATRLVSLDLSEGANEAAIERAIARAGYHPKRKGGG